MVGNPSLRDPNSKCSICGNLFHEPLMGAFRNYDYRRTTLSDEHRMMFHSADPNNRAYDPDLGVAALRLQAGQDRRAAALEAAIRNHELYVSDTPGPTVRPFRADIDPNAREVSRDAD